MTADQVLDKLVNLGCTESQEMSAMGRFVRFTDMRKPRKNELASLCRAIRSASLLERTGQLVADIDRMGRVIGWHKSMH